VSDEIDGLKWTPETGPRRPLSKRDLNHAHPPGPDWDYRDRDGQWWRIFSDGRMEAK
jgi:hypothetical protein